MLRNKIQQGYGVYTANMASNTNDSSKFRSFGGGSGGGFPSAFGKKSSFAPREEPYHIRKAREDAAAKKAAEEKAERGREFNEVNYPALGGASSSWGSAPAAGGGKAVSFAALATEWKARDDAEKERAEIAEMRRQREEAERIAFSRVRPPPPRFGFSHSRREDTHEEEEEYPRYGAHSPIRGEEGYGADGGASDDEGGWTSVQRPAKKPRTMRSYAPPPPQSSNTEEDSCWGQDHTSRGHEQDSIW